MKAISSALIGTLAAIGVTLMAFAADADPVIGTWKLNVDKSRFGGMPALKSEIRTYARSTDGFKLTIKSVSAEGKETTTQATYHLDGKDFPSMGNPDFDSLSGTQVDPDTAEFILKRSGQEIGKIRRAVSKDGRILTINYVLKNAAGAQTTALTVFDKQ